MRHELKNEAGNKYGRLSVIEFSHIDKQGSAHWRCLCDCGEESTPSGHDLRRGHTRSCNCYMRDQTAAFNRSHKTLTDADRHLLLIRALFTFVPTGQRSVAQ